MGFNPENYRYSSPSGIASNLLHALDEAADWLALLEERKLPAKPNCGYRNGTIKKLLKELSEKAEKLL